MTSSQVSGFNPVSIKTRLVDGALIIDNTTLEHFLTCPRKGYLARVRRRRPDKPRPALDFGSAVHVALEHRYRTLGNQPVTPDVEAEMIRLGTAELLRNTYPTDYRNEGFLEHVLRTYNANYGEEPFEIVKNDAGTPLVEAPFAVPLPPIYHGHPDLPNPLPLIWAGKIDLVLKWSNGTYATGDHKTSAMSGAYYFQEYHLSQPQIGYIYAVQKQLKPEVDRFMINALFCRKPAASGKINLEFQREQIYVTPDMLLEWEQNTLNAVKLILVMDMLNYPAAYKSCITKYGPCAYHDLCTLSRAEREKALESNLYVDDHWSPLNHE